MWNCGYRLLIKETYIHRELNPRKRRKNTWEIDIRKITLKRTYTY